MDPLSALTSASTRSTRETCSSKHRLTATWVWWRGLTSSKGGLSTRLKASDSIDFSYSPYRYTSLEIRVIFFATVRKAG